MITTEQKIIAIICHIGYLIGGIGLVIIPLIIYIVKKDDDFVAQHAKQALVAQSLLAIAGIATGILCAILIGFLLIPFLAILAIIFFFISLFAAYAVFCGNSYQYPFIQGLVNRF